jgi:hypothetical protein
MVIRRIKWRRKGEMIFSNAPEDNTYLKMLKLK